MKGSWRSILLTALSIAPATPVGALNVVCSLDRPVVGPQQQVKATALADTPDPSSLHFLWRAQGGGFSGQGFPREASGAAVQWYPNGSAPGLYTLTVTVTGAKGSSGACSLAVMVGSEERGVDLPQASGFGREVGRALLVKGRSERKGYGLYSYMLLGGSAAGAARERYQKFAETYLQKILDVKQLETYFKPAQLNITYLPVDGEPPERLSVDWILDHYEYARARLILSSLPGSHGEGPFIVSSLHPLDGPGSVAGPYVFEDLSKAPVTVIEFWVNQFLSQTSQQRFWEAKTLDTVALRLRTAIAVAAAGLPEARAAVATWISVSPNK